jgi:hypothetical protein
VHATDLSGELPRQAVCGDCGKQKERRSEECHMKMRAATIVIALLDALAGIALAAVYLNSASDQATIGFDHAAGVVVVGLFVLTGLPALVLAVLGRAPKTALGLALAFPTAFVVLAAVAVLYFAALS